MSSRSYELVPDERAPASSPVEFLRRLWRSADRVQLWAQQSDGVDLAVRKFNAYELARVRARPPHSEQREPTR